MQDFCEGGGTGIFRLLVRERFPHMRMHLYKRAYQLILQMRAYRSIGLCTVTCRTSTYSAVTVRWPILTYRWAPVPRDTEQQKCHQTILSRSTSRDNSVTCTNRHSCWTGSECGTTARSSYNLKAAYKSS